MTHTALHHYEQALDYLDYAMPAEAQVHALLALTVVTAEAHHLNPATAPVPTVAL